MLFEEDPRLELLIGIAPFGVAGARSHAASSLPHARILFGGIYDWYDPIAGDRGSRARARDAARGHADLHHASESGHHAAGKTRRGDAVCEEQVVRLRPIRAVGSVRTPGGILRTLRPRAADVPIARSRPICRCARACTTTSGADCRSSRAPRRERTRF